MLKNNLLFGLLLIYVLCGQAAFGMERKSYMWGQDGVTVLREQLMAPAKPTPKSKIPASLYQYFGLNDDVGTLPPEIVMPIINYVMADDQWWYGKAKVCHKGPVKIVRYSPDGALLATGSMDKTVCLWDNEGKNIGTMRYPCNVSSLEFHPFKPLLMVATDDGALRFSDLKSTEIKKVVGGSTANDIAFNPKATHLASVSSKDNRLRLWRPGHQPEILHQQLWYLKKVAFHPQSNVLVTSAGTATQLWTIADNKLVPLEADLEGTPMEPLMHNAEINDLAFQPQGHLLATVCQDGIVTLWNMAWERMLTIPPEMDSYHAKPYPVTAVDFHPQGKLFATLLNSYKGLVLIRDLAGRKVAQLSHQTQIHGLSFHPKVNMLAVACEDNTAKIWQYHQGPLEQILLRLVLKQYIIKCIAARRRPQPPVSKSPNNFAHWMAEWFNLDEPKLQAVWTKFPTPLQNSIVSSYIYRVDKVAQIEQDIASNERWRQEDAACKKRNGK